MIRCDNCANTPNMIDELWYIPEYYDLDIYVCHHCLDAYQNMELIDYNLRTDDLPDDAEQFEIWRKENEQLKNEYDRHRM